MRGFSIAVALLADADPFIREAGMLSYTCMGLKQTLVYSPRGFRGSGHSRHRTDRFHSSDGPFSSSATKPLSPRGTLFTVFYGRSRVSSSPFILS